MDAESETAAQDNGAVLGFMASVLLGNGPKITEPAVRTQDNVERMRKQLGGNRLDLYDVMAGDTLTRVVGTPENGLPMAMLPRLKGGLSPQRRAQYSKEQSERMILLWEARRAAAGLPAKKKTSNKNCRPVEVVGSKPADVRNAIAETLKLRAHEAYLERCTAAGVDPNFEKWWPESYARDSKGILVKPLISVEGNVYATITDVMELLGLSSSVLYRRLRSPEPEFRNWFYLKPATES